MNSLEKEQDKYNKCYERPGYKMGRARMETTKKCLDFIFSRKDSEIKTALDVSAGRGEMVDFLRDVGVHTIGTEIVDSLLVEDKIVFAWSHALPFGDNSVDLVLNLDAMEHYLPEQTEEIIQEFCRVSKRWVYFAISNIPDKNQYGDDLHINRRKYEDWYSLLGKYGDVTWLYQGDNRISENFLLEIATEE